MQARIPATIVTGFLGAGKTSLVRHLVSRAGNRRLAFIINEFGELGIDRELLLGCGLEGCGDDDIVELANGCLCCTVADDFLPTMRRLLDRPQPPEHIIVETSGLALPKPLLKAFGWPDVRTRATVDGVVAMIDAEAVLAGTFAPDPAAVAAQRSDDPALDHDSPLEELLEEQLGCADLVLINKADRIERSERRRVEAAVAAHTRPGVRHVWTQHGQIDPAIALGLGVGVEDDLAGRRSHTDTEEEHDHDDFTSFVVELPPIDDPVRIEQAIRDVARAHPVYRVKGFMAVLGKPSRMVVQAVGDRVERYFDRPWRPDEPRSTRLVVIGAAGLDRQAIAAAFAG